MYFDTLDVSYSAVFLKLRSGDRWWSLGCCWAVPWLVICYRNRVFFLVLVLMKAGPEGTNIIACRSLRQKDHPLPVPESKKFCYSVFINTSCRYISFFPIPFKFIANHRLEAKCLGVFILLSTAGLALQVINLDQCLLFGIIGNSEFGCQGVPQLLDKHLRHKRGLRQVMWETMQGLDIKEDSDLWFICLGLIRDSL